MCHPFFQSNRKYELILFRGRKPDSAPKIWGPGASILAEGGTAIDAVIAVQLAHAVLEPQFTGLGGGMYVMLFNATAPAEERVRNLDGREEAPSAYHPNIFCKNSSCMHDPTCGCEAGAVDFSERCAGGLPVGVPGTVAALSELGKLATLPLPRLAAPAVHLARFGFPMYKDLYNMIASRAAYLARYEDTRCIYLKPDGVTPIAAINETFVNRDLADTIESLASMGPQGMFDEFYRGKLAAEIINASHAANPISGKYGILSQADMSGYKAVWRAPYHVDVKLPGDAAPQDVRVWGAAMPFSGGAALGMMLQLLQRSPAANYSGNATMSDAIGALIDIQNVVFADRDQYMADADFVDVPVDGLLSDAYADQRSKLLRGAHAVQTPVRPGLPPGTAPAAAQQPPSNGLDHGTTHWSVVDAAGNMAAVTATVNLYFGSQIVVPGRGFLLNDEMCDFEGTGFVNGTMKANAAEGGKRMRRTALGEDAASFGGKRPRSSTTPTIVTHAAPPYAPQMATGSPGGSSIIGGVLNVLWRRLFQRMELQSATDAPRAISKNCDGGSIKSARRLNDAVGANCHASLEPEFDAETTSQLKQQGYSLDFPSKPRPYPGDGDFHAFGSVQSVWVDATGQIGSADDTRVTAAAALGPVSDATKRLEIDGTQEVSVSRLDNVMPVEVWNTDDDATMPRPPVPQIKQQRQQ